MGFLYICKWLQKPSGGSSLAIYLFVKVLKLGKLPGMSPRLGLDPKRLCSGKKWAVDEHLILTMCRTEFLAWAYNRIKAKFKHSPNAKCGLWWCWPSRWGFALLAYRYDGSL